MHVPVHVCEIAVEGELGCDGGVRRWGVDVKSAFG